MDAFCENIAFSAAQSERLFEASPARAAGATARRAAFEHGGSRLAARYGALSSDHLEYVDDDDAAALARAGTVAVLLPVAFYALPRRSCRRSSVARARRADGRGDRLQPGGSRASLLLAMNMA